MSNTKVKYKTSLKITEEHYNLLQKQINEKCFKEEICRVYVDAEKSLERARWDIYHRYVSHDLRKQLYVYLNDNHIDSAMRNIFGHSE